MPGLTVTSSSKSKSLGQTLDEFDQQKQVEQVASIAATALSTAGVNEIAGNNHTLSYQEDSSSLTIDDSKTGENLVKAEFDGQRWQDKDSNLSPQRTRDFSRQTTAKIQQFKQESQQQEQEGGLGL